MAKPASLVAYSVAERVDHKGVHAHTVLVALPGLGGNALSLEADTLRALGAAVGARWVLAVTYATPFGPTLQAAAQRVWCAVCAFLADGLTAASPTTTTRVVLAGYSLGGMMAQCMARDVPRALPPHQDLFQLAGAVYIASATPSATALPIPNLLREAAAALAPARAPVHPIARGHARLQTMFPKPWLAAAPAAAVDAMAQAIASGRVEPATRTAQLGAVVRFLLGGPVGGPVGEHPAAAAWVAPRGLPVLVVHGPHDRILSWSAARDAAARTPSATFVSMDDTGHGLMFQEPRALADHVARWWHAQARAPRTSAPAAPPATVVVAAQPPAVLFVDD